MTVETKPGDDAGDVRVHATVRLIGAVDRAAITEASGTIRGLIAAGLRHVVVDLSETDEVDGRLLTMLARTHAQLGADPERPGSLRIVGVQLPQFLAALQAAPLEEVFVIYDAMRYATTDPVAPRAVRPRPRLADRLLRDPAHAGGDDATGWVHTRGATAAGGLEQAVADV